MSRKEKLLKEIENAPNNVRFELLERLLKESGFVLKSVKGSHHSFSKSEALDELEGGERLGRAWRVLFSGGHLAPSQRAMKGA